MNMVLITREGIVDLAAFTMVKVVKRAGYKMIVGEIAGQLIEHTLAFLRLDPDGAPVSYQEEFLDAFHQCISQTNNMAKEAFFSVVPFTMEPTEKMLADLAHYAQLSMEDRKPAPAPAPELPQQVKKKIIVRFEVVKGDQTYLGRIYARLKSLENHTIARVEMGSDGTTAIITEGD